MEIGNKWIYVREHRYNWYISKTAEVIGDTTINNNIYAKFINNYGQISFERADSSKVYWYYLHYNQNYSREYILIDYSRSDGLYDCATGECTRITQGYEFFLDSLRQQMLVESVGGNNYRVSSYIKGIGRIYYDYSGHGDDVNTGPTKLIYAKIGELIYDNYPRFEVKSSTNFINTPTFEVIISTDSYTGSESNTFEIFEYRIDSGNWQNLPIIPIYNSPVNLLINSGDERIHKIEIHTVDIFGHERNETFEYIVDRTSPTIQILNILSPDLFYNNGLQNIDIDYNVIDDNFDKVGYQLNDNDWVWSEEQNGSFNIEGLNGNSTILIKAVDLADNESTESFNIIVDNVRPVISILSSLDSLNFIKDNSNQFTIEYEVADDNFNKIGYSINDNLWVWSDEQQSTLNIATQSKQVFIKIKAVDLAGNESEVIEINVEKIDKYKLSNNYPNPFNPTTQISYEIPKNSEVELTIYNTLGKEITKLVKEQQQVGRYYINWNGQNSLGEQVPAGIYFYTLKTKDFTKTRKMLLLR